MPHEVVVDLLLKNSKGKDIGIFLLAAKLEFEWKVYKNKSDVSEKNALNDFVTEIYENFRRQIKANESTSKQLPVIKFITDKLEKNPKGIPFDKLLSKHRNTFSSVFSPCRAKGVNHTDVHYSSKKRYLTAIKLYYPSFAEFSNTEFDNDIDIVKDQIQSFLKNTTTNQLTQSCYLVCAKLYSFVYFYQKLDDIDNISFKNFEQAFKQVWASESAKNSTKLNELHRSIFATVAQQELDGFELDKDTEMLADEDSVSSADCSNSQSDIQARPRQFGSSFFDVMPEVAERKSVSDFRALFLSRRSMLGENHEGFTLREKSASKAIAKKYCYEMFVAPRSIQRESATTTEWLDCGT